MSIKSKRTKIRGWDIQATDILSFTPGVELECYVAAAVRAGMHDSRKYGMRLISGAIRVLKDFARRGIMIKKLYGVSDTPDGKRLSRGVTTQVPSRAFLSSKMLTIVSSVAILGQNEGLL